MPMSLQWCQWVRNTFLGSAFQIILNSWRSFPTRGGTEAQEPRSSPRRIQEYHSPVGSALGLGILHLGKSGRTRSWFQGKLYLEKAGRTRKWFKQTSGSSWWLTIEQWNFFFTLFWPDWKQRSVCSCWGRDNPRVNSFSLGQEAQLGVTASLARIDLGLNVSLSSF